MKMWITLFIIIYTLSIHAQSPKITLDNKLKLYSYDNKYYTFSQLGSIFEYNPTLDKRYKAITKCITKSTNFGLSAIALGVLGGVAFASHEPPKHCEFTCLSDGKAAGYLLLATATGLGIAALNISGKANVEKKKLIDLFNSGDYSLLDYSKTELPTLSLASEGIGILIRF